VISQSQTPLSDKIQHTQEQTSTPRAGFEPTITGSERSQTHLLDRVAIRISYEAYVCEYTHLAHVNVVSCSPSSSCSSICVIRTIKMHFSLLIYFSNDPLRGPGSSVSIATELRAGRSGIESRWGRNVPPVQTGPGAHPASCKIGTGSFPGVKCGRDVLLTNHSLLVPRSWKSIAIPIPTFWATPGL